MKTRVSLGYFVTDCLRNPFLILARVATVQTYFFDHFGRSTNYCTVLPAVRAIKLQRRANICLTS